MIVVWIIGFVSLAGEIALARLVAPYWGSGTVVWSTIIAIVLGALALGYWIGGKLADRYPRSQSLALWIMPGVLLLLAMPYLGRLLLGDNAVLFLLFVVLGSLAFFFLGATTPWILRVRNKSTEHSGELAGKLFAVSTIGSFLGTLLCALLLLPHLGTGRTFFLLGGLGVLALGLLDKKMLLLLPLPIALFLLWQAPLAPGILWEGESAEQHIRVRETNGIRVLEINDGKNVQSAWRPDQQFSGDFWDTPLLLWGASEQQTPGDLLVLGNGAGITGTEWIEAFRQPVWGVELDPLVTEMGRRYFEMNPRLKVLHGDARRTARGIDRSFSTIFLDTYDESFVPFHLLTEEFFLEIGDRIKPRGVLVINIHASRDIVRVLGHTTLQAFPYGLVWKYKPGNRILVLSKRPLERKRIFQKMFLLPTALQAEARRAAQELQPLPRRGPLWTDDLAPAELYSE